MVLIIERYGVRLVTSQLWKYYAKNYEPEPGFFEDGGRAHQEWSKRANEKAEELFLSMAHFEISARIESWKYVIAQDKNLMKSGIKMTPAFKDRLKDQIARCVENLNSCKEALREINKELKTPKELELGAEFLGDVSMTTLNMRLSQALSG